MTENPLQTIHIVGDIPSNIEQQLKALAEHYPIVFESASDNVLQLRIHHNPELAENILNINDKQATIEYHSVAGALRHVGALLSDCLGGDVEYAEATPLKTIGIMLDCSRNAVMTVEHFQHWLRRLALMGYNMAMLYTEDTYELPDEPFFGYQRGAYTPEELKQINGYAKSLGIEMIGCIQTLGHLEQILKWGAYGDIKDSPSVIMVDDDRSYELIGKMLDNYAECYTSRRIHIGMDETYGLGRGGFLERYGLQDRFEIFNRHLKRVTDMCRERGLEPMIWSDMYFSIGSKTNSYYDLEAVIPDEVVDAIPAETQLVYWDYYHDQPDEYESMIKRHRDMHHEPVMGSGVWTWGPGNLWHHYSNTTQKAGACVEASRKAGLEEIFFTLWGDDGATCDIDSSLAGLAWTAEKCYNPDGDEAVFCKRFDQLNQSSFQTHKALADMHSLLQLSNVLWDDPLLGIYLQSPQSSDEQKLIKSQKLYDELSAKAKEASGQNGAGDFDYLAALLDVLSIRCGIAQRLAEAWAKRDKIVLADIKEDLPGLIEKMEALSELARQRWYSAKKAQGLEVVQIRYAGVIARLRELEKRLTAWLNGDIDTIEELDANIPDAPSAYLWANYHRVATGSCIL